MTEERKRFLKLIELQDEDIERALNALSSRLKEAMVIAEGLGGIDKKSFFRAGAFLLSEWTSAFENIIIRRNKQAVNIATEEAIKITGDVFPTLVLGGYVDRGAEMYRQLDTALLRRNLFPDGITLGARIKTIESRYMQTVKDILYVGMREGKSAFEIAAEIDNIVVPKDWKTWVSPHEFYRDRLDKTGKISSHIRKPGSVSYNSFRIARTEINQTYRDATVRVHGDEPWIKGFRWRLSAAHSIPCECEDMHDTVYPPGEVPPSPHPNCMCTLEPVLVEPKLTT